MSSKLLTFDENVSIWPPMSKIDSSLQPPVWTVPRCELSAWR